MDKIMDLDDEWRDIIQAQLQWVDGWIFPGSESNFKGPEGRIRLLQLIMDSKALPKKEAFKLRCLGTYLGQAITEKTGWPWKVVEDEHGIDLAIQIPWPNGWIFPLNLISRKVENNEPVDVKELFDSLVR